MTRHTKNFQLSSFNFQLIIVLASTMLTSCVNDIPYDAEIGAPKLVLNAMLRADSTLKATVGRTAHFLDTEEPQRLSDATVTAAIGEHSVVLTYDEPTQTYLSSYTLHAGDEVTLTATHTLGTVSATERVMPPTPIAIAHTAMLPFTPPGDPLSAALLNKVDSALLVSIYIDDPAEEANYYRLTIHYEGSYEVTFPDDIYTRDYHTTAEAFFPHYLFTESSTRLLTTSESMSQMFSGLLYMSSTNSFLFTDQNLRNADGQPIVDFLFLLESPASPDYNPESGWGEGDGWDDNYISPADTASRATYHYAFTLERLSEDYYQYMEDATAFAMTGGAFVGEPTPVHTNIRGGLGIVGSYNSAECGGEKRYELR